MAWPSLRAGLRLSRCESCGGGETTATATTPIPDPNNVGYNAILIRAGSSARPAIQDLARLEISNAEDQAMAFWRLPATQAQAVLNLELHATGTGAAPWFARFRQTALDFNALDPATGRATSNLIQVHVVRGRSERRAMVIGGVHNRTEPQGQRVVDALRAVSMPGRPGPSLSPSRAVTV